MAFESDNEIQALIEQYARMESVVYDRLRQAMKDGGNPLIQITHRIKTAESIKKKLQRKPELYPNAASLYDILGFRVICFFLDDVDLAARLIADHFRVDWSRSKDKRQLIDAKSFGYLSLHFVCALPEEAGEFGGLWFEIQIKTILQHSWAEIEHDLGYKAEIEVPRNVRRLFARAASLLEITDDIFVDIRGRLSEYRDKVADDMKNKSLDDLFFDAITLAVYTSHNATYLNMLNEIASITNAHITEGSLERQLPLIEFLGIRTLQEMTDKIIEKHGLIMKLARKSLQDSELDELSSTVALHYLYRAELISGGYSRERIREFFMLTAKDEKKVENSTEKIMRAREELCAGPVKARQ